ncbi:choice-of-anchor Q domain-containing protein [Massilia sp. BSC265]|uniref:choice-of-anchor Q domain-containing protein n=1 Tax=Massilia sp. BSC265 TaxID=1549812 RepID=UPI0006916985|nr:choice-of-anchor Q domain-containing protein [Massilia sp. BSC265]
MKNVVNFASNARVNAALCSAAVLLTALGGNAYAADNAMAFEATVAAATAASSSVDQVTGLYRTLLGREPDTAGLAYWSGLVSDGLPLDSVRAGITSSQEYTNRTVAAATTSFYHLYVATTGSDSNPGTQARPFKTINKAASVAKANTTVHVAPGTYYGNVSTRLSGTSTGAIRFVSDTKWGAKIVGSGTEVMWLNNGSYVEINGFDISGPGRLGIQNMGSNTLVTNNRVHHITVSGGCTGSGGAGIVNANYTSSAGHIIGNVVHDIGKPGGCNGVQGIYSSNKGSKILNNIVYRASAYGIHLWHAATDSIIANNTVFANGSSGMGGGIVTGVGDKPGNIQLKNTMVVNNIVYKNPRQGISQYCYSGQNCIGSGNVTANNLVNGNGSAITLRAGSATGTVTADPKFVSYNPTGAGDYRLQSTSPAVNKGTKNYAPTVDILNVARPKGGAWDIGAYENY